MISEGNFMSGKHSFHVHVSTHVKSQAGSWRDPNSPTWDPGWEWRDPATLGGISSFPPGIKNQSHPGSRLKHGIRATHLGSRMGFMDPTRDPNIPPGMIIFSAGIFGGIQISHLGLTHHTHTRPRMSCSILWYADE